LVLYFAQAKKIARHGSGNTKSISHLKELPRFELAQNHTKI
jgi:hypothetical protein